MNSDSKPPSDPEPLKARQLTADEAYFREWGRDSLKESIAVANEVSRQLLTLATALAAGSIAFLGDDMISGPYKVFAVVAFLLALVVALLGVLPVEAVYALDRPAHIRATKEAALRWKRRLIYAAAVCIATGLGCAAGGVLVKALA